MINGKLHDVHAVVDGDERNPNVYGVFPTERQAEGYVRERIPESSARVVGYRGWQYDNSPRVLLLKQVGHVLYDLNVDYEPEEDRVRRELKKSAWAKLTAAERDALGWSREP